MHVKLYTASRTAKDKVSRKQSNIKDLFKTVYKRVKIYPLAHRAKRGARVLISTCVESCYTRGDSAIALLEDELRFLALFSVVYTIR